MTHNSLVIQPSKTLLKEYLRYAIDSRDLSSVITGTSQPQITIQNLNELEVPIAPLAEQGRLWRSCWGRCRRASSVCREFLIC